MLQASPGSVTGFVLAGGMSSRMGRDKAFVQWQGESLLNRALNASRAVAAEVMIVGQRSKFLSYGPVVEDVFERRGPLAGIHAALAATATELNLILAVDLPLMEPPFLKYLLHCAQATRAIVTLPRVAGRWQPLCAVYRKQFGHRAREALKAGENRIDSLFSDSDVLSIADEEIRGAGFSIDIFRNLNTPEDLREASQS